MRAEAPAKIILSGEHSVLQGAPALALAVKRYLRVDWEPGPRPGRVRLWLPEAESSAGYRDYDTGQLLAVQEACRRRHQAYLDGRLQVARVLGGHSLPAAALGLLLAETGLEFASGLTLKLSSEVPSGAGMGSSAAVCAAVQLATAVASGLNPEAARLTTWVTRAEALQHGRSSGLDPAVVVRGGWVRFEAGKVETLDIPHWPDCGWWLGSSGAPANSTGEVVTAVQRRCPPEARIWQDFGETTRALEEALHARDTAKIGEALRANHRLLLALGVVPPALQAWIADWESRGGAAKICGAGALQGSSAGTLLAYHPDPEHSPPAANLGWRPLEIDRHGTRIRS